jgi:hypothetical protein
LSPDERFEILRRAQVWQLIDTGSLDLLAGPPADDAFSFEEEVTCRYTNEPPPSGRTPKFNCVVPSGDVVKVKYGRENREVFAEVAATRLFWALGFGTESLTGTLGNPLIGEAGRAFLADRLMDLSDRQIRDLFTAARADEAGETIGDGAAGRPVTVDDWVSAFRRRRAQITDHRCPA